MILHRLNDWLRRRPPSYEPSHPPTPREELFDPGAQDLARYKRDMNRLPPAGTQYVMHFTPRSGSSWVHDIARSTGRLGNPGECFNPAFVPRMSARMNAADMKQFVNMLVRKRGKEGVFGCQVTHHQLLHCFGSDEAFMGHFPDARVIWLLREDIVLQAVSLEKKRQTRIAHSPQADARARAVAEEAFVYDARWIRQFVEHILRAEEGAEALFARYGLSPLRMSYEHNVSMGAADVLNALAHHIGVSPIPREGITSGHGKLGTDRNAEFAERFRTEERRLLAQIERTRAPWLAAVDRSLPDRLPANYRAG